MRHLGKTLLAAALLYLPSTAHAVAIVGGDTRVAFSGAITGLDVGLTGGTTLVGGAPGLTINIPITGGDLDAALAGTIRHDGSGVTLSNGTNILALSNFVIDTTQSLLFGDASLNGSLVGTSLSLFSFDLGTVTVPQLTDLDNPLLSLVITPTASGALTTAFGFGDTTGVSIGLAATSPQAVPEPEAWALMILGFGLTGAVLRRRTQVAIAATTA